MLENVLMNPSHRHDHQDLVAHSFELDQPLDPHRFEHWITMLLFLSGYQVYRIKGVLNFKGESNKVIFQSVRSNSKLDIGSPWRSGEVRKTRIVFIGSNIQRAPLEKGLKSCLK
jgi:G3E family GTPase